MTRVCVDGLVGTTKDGVEFWGSQSDLSLTALILVSPCIAASSYPVSLWGTSSSPRTRAPSGSSLGSQFPPCSVHDVLQTSACWFLAGVSWLPTRRISTYPPRFLLIHLWSRSKRGNNTKTSHYIRSQLQIHCRLFANIPRSRSRVYK